MAQIAILSNHTRSTIRPPLQSSVANFAMLLQIFPKARRRPKTNGSLSSSGLKAEQLPARPAFAKAARSKGPGSTQGTKDRHASKAPGNSRAVPSAPALPDGPEKAPSSTSSHSEGALVAKPAPAAPKEQTARPRLPAWIPSEPASTPPARPAFHADFRRAAGQQPYRHLPQSHSGNRPLTDKEIQEPSRSIPEEKTPASDAAIQPVERRDEISSRGRVRSSLFDPIHFERKLPASTTPSPSQASQEPLEPAAGSQVRAIPQDENLPDRESRDIQPGKDQRSLDVLIHQQAGLPAQTSILGVCEDGLPVLLDLNDPTPGSLLVIGDDRSSQLGLLRTLIASVASRNTARGIQIVVITCDVPAWREWVTAQAYDRYCLSIEGVDQVGDLSDWVMRLGDWIEERRSGQRSGPPILLIMDTLSFLPRLAEDIRQNFEWMVKEGPAARIWPVAAISTDLARLLENRQMLEPFTTHICGLITNQSTLQKVAGTAVPEAASSFQSGQFAVQLGETWLRFSLPG